MHIITRLFQFIGISAILAGCGGGGHHGNWYSGDTDTPITAPAQLQYGTPHIGMYGTDSQHNIAVLLPVSGPNAPIGKAIRPGIEAAAMQFAPNGLEIKFYDTGTGNVSETIQTALSNNPGIIIGPVFAENAKILRDMKPYGTPALAFTSDISAVGDGVISMSVMPTNTIEAIIQEMQSKGATRFIIMAPNNTSGQIMAGAARAIDDAYNVQNNGVFYYNEHDTESIKSVAMSASMYTARSAANTRAKEILSAILNHENLAQSEKVSIANQLEKINRTDTLGDLPYDAILFMGTGDDTKSLVSFLRYYGVGVRDAMFYGTPLWENSNISSDIAMTGAVFATLPEISDNFSELYKNATGTDVNRMAAIGYDATILAIGALYGNRDIATYIMNPSGYVGINGLFRLRPNGSNERALQLVRLNGDGTTTTVKPSATAFTIPVYKTQHNYIAPASGMSLVGNGVNPMNYIKIPERLRGKYHAKTYGANYSTEPSTATADFPTVTVLQTPDSNFSITAEHYEPVPLESVGRTYIDSVEISE